jgi:hypothetical protein
LASRSSSRTCSTCELDSAFVAAANAACSTAADREEEDFDGKRPFGNSRWQTDLGHALVRAGLVNGEVDRHGNVDWVDYEAARPLVLAAIDSLGK